MSGNRKNRGRKPDGFAAPECASSHAHIASAYASQRQRGVGGKTFEGGAITGRMVAWELTRSLLPYVRERVLAATR